MSGSATAGTGRLAGFRNQARRESSMWWQTGRWRRQALLWSAMLVGLLASMLWVLPAVLGGLEGSEALVLEVDEAAAQFAELATLMIAVGSVVLAQGLLIDDRRSGLMEWVLSKPLTRPALVMAKFVGHASGVLAALVAVPWVAVWALLSVADGAPWPVGRWLGAVALVGLLALFLVSLVVALSALTWSRGVALGLPLALILGGDVLSTLLPRTALANPFLLGRVAAGMLATGELMAVGPVVAAFVGAGLLLGVAIRSMNRHDL